MGTDINYVKIVQDPTAKIHIKNKPKEYKFINGETIVYPFNRPDFKAI